MAPAGPLWISVMASLKKPWVKIILLLADNVPLADVPLYLALEVSTVLRFPLLLDTRVGAPYQLVSSISADVWQRIYNWANISILGLSLGQFFGWPHILYILLFFTAIQSAGNCCYLWFCRGILHDFADTIETSCSCVARLLSWLMLDAIVIFFEAFQQHS